MKDIGKPCAGKPHARFDEGGLGLSATAELLGHRQTKGPATDNASPTVGSTCSLLYPYRQDVHGYPVGKYHQDALKLASKWVGHTFGCLSLTLEMPFKDNANLPDPEFGWSGERSRKLGAAALEPLLATLTEG